MASRSQSQARSLPVQENKNKATDVNSNSKPGKSLAAQSQGGSNGGGANNGGGKRRDNKNLSRRGGGYGGPPSGGQQYGGEGSYGRQNRHGNNRGRRGGSNYGGNDSRQMSSQAGNRYSAVTEADEIEIGSVFKSGSKKQNLNHLLNFKKYEPQRGGGGGNNYYGGGGVRRNPRQGKWQGKNRYVPVVKYTREQYLAANCQFLVKASGDYSVQVVDPDIPVDWEYIEEVKLFTPGTEPLNCPICLFPPRPGKIGRCGHVFCWPCILHYLALSDDDYRKCPICEDKIHKEDLKSVRIYPQETYSTGSTIELRLMKRERNSLFAVPVTHPGLESLPCVEDSILDRSLSKLVKGSPEQVIQLVLDRERSELEALYAVEKNTPESVFITQAIKLLEEKVESCVLESIALATHQALPVMVEPALFDRHQPQQEPVTEMKILATSMKALDPFSDDYDKEVEALKKQEVEIMSPQSDDPTSPVTDSSVTSDTVTDTSMTDASPVTVGEAGEEEGFARPRHTSSGSSGSSEGEAYVETTITADDLDISSVQNVHQQSADSSKQQASNKPKDVFYFYQAVNGQRIFLHALNIQMLVYEYGTLEACPHTITAKILEMDSSSMSEDLRQRLRYLRHMPLSCSFDVAELDLNAQLSRKTIAQFKDQLAERRKQRQRKMTAEQRREKKIRLEEMRIMGRFPSPMARIQSVDHYPSMDNPGLQDHYPSMDNSGTQDHYPGIDDPELVPAEGAIQQDPAQSSEVGGQGSGSTFNFASIAKKAKTPAVKQKQTQVEEPTYVGVSGSGMVRLGGPLPRARAQAAAAADSDSEPEQQGYVQQARPTATLGASLAQALAQVGQKNVSSSNKKKGRRGRGIPVQL